MSDKWKTQIVTVKIENKEYTDRVSIAGLEAWLSSYEHKEHFVYKLHKAFHEKLTGKSKKKKEVEKDEGKSKTSGESKE